MVVKQYNHSESGGQAYNHREWLSSSTTTESGGQAVQPVREWWSSSTTTESVCQAVQPQRVVVKQYNQSESGGQAVQPQRVVVKLDTLTESGIKQYNHREWWSSNTTTDSGGQAIQPQRVVVKLVQPLSESCTQAVQLSESGGQACTTTQRVVVKLDHHSLWLYCLSTTLRVVVCLTTTESGGQAVPPVRGCGA